MKELVSLLAHSVRDGSRLKDNFIVFIGNICSVSKSMSYTQLY